MIVIAIGFPSFWLLLKEAPDAESGTLAARSAEALGDNVLPADAVRHSAFRLMFVAVAMGAGSIAAIITHMTPIATGAGMSGFTGAWALGGLFLVNAIWQVGVGLLLDRSADPRIAAPFVLVSAAGALVIAFAGTPAMLMCGALLVGLGCGTEYGLLPFSIPRYYGLRFYGEIYGWIFGAIMLVQGLAPFLMDLTYGLTGSYRVALYAIAAVLACSAALVTQLPPYRFGSPTDRERSLAGLAAEAEAA